MIRNRHRTPEEQAALYRDALYSPNVRTDGDARLWAALADAATPEVEQYLAAEQQTQPTPIFDALRRAYGDRPRIPAAELDVNAAVLGPVAHLL